jgi:hypothetical protein
MCDTPESCLKYLKTLKFSAVIFGNWMEDANFTEVLSDIKIQHSNLPFVFFTADARNKSPKRLTNGSTSVSGKAERSGKSRADNQQNNVRRLFIIKRVKNQKERRIIFALFGFFFISRISRKLFLSQPRGETAACCHFYLQFV